VTLFARPVDVITREPVRVMQASCPDEIAAIQWLWPHFESLVGLRGRKMYAAADVAAGTYTTCCPIRPDDDPHALGLEVGELPGGRFRRGRLVGEPPEVYERIGPGVQELEALGSVDRSRPVVEFYRRRDEIELWVPITAGSRTPRRGGPEPPR
jgi:hypothetical protein